MVAARLLGCPATTTAQSAPDDVIRALLARIEALEERVKALEGGATPAVVAAAAATTEASPAPTLRLNTGLQEHAKHAVPSPAQDPMAAQEFEYPALKLTGFSDLNFSATDQPGVRSGFTAGQFSLHLTSALSPRVAFFGELTLSTRADAGTGSPAAPGFNAEVERSIIRLDRNDYFKVSFGRYHTPINWWNTAFHHGQWLQTTISRPEMTQFGGQFIPVHFVGGLVEGTAPAGGLNISYKAGVGNGRGPVLSRGGDAGDTNNNRAWVVNAFTRPERLFGLQVGGSLYLDEITLPGAGSFDERILSAHVVWQREDPEAIFEFADAAHAPTGGTGTVHSRAYYAQLAYRLPWFRQLWKPYYRYERVKIAAGDFVFRNVPNLDGSTLGIRYDISTFAAIKAEYRNLRHAPAERRINGGFFQTSFTF
jgi:hypothetical protein